MEWGNSMNRYRFYNEHALELANFFGDAKRLNLLLPFIPELNSLELQLDRPLRVLDLGAGTGMHANHLAEINHYEVVAVDPSEEMLRQGQINYPNAKITFIQDSLPELVQIPKNDLFDAVISIAAFQYIKPDELQKAMERVLQQLKPNGVFVIVWPIPMSREFQFPLQFDDLKKVLETINEQLPETLKIRFNEGISIPDPDQRKGYGVDQDKDVVFHSLVGHMPADNSLSLVARL